MYNLSSYLFVALLLCCTGGRGQSFQVQGQVVNTQKQPVEFMDVYLTNDTHTTLSHAYTDSLGHFILKAEQGNYSLNIAYFGHDLFTKSIDLTKNMNLGILVIDTVFVLEEVSIKTPGNLVHQQGDKLFFDIENSSLATGYNGKDILRRSPKIQISSDGSIQVRKKEMQIQVNGRAINMNQEDLNNYLESLGSEDIKRVEIQDVGDGSTEASNNGGVVNIVLKKGRYGFRGVIKTGVTYYKPTYHNYFGDANLAYGQNTWNAYVISGTGKNNTKGTYDNQFDYEGYQRQQEQQGEFLQNNSHYQIRTGMMFYPNKKHEFGVEFFLKKEKDWFTDYQLIKIYKPLLDVDGETNSITNDATVMGYFTVNYLYAIDTLGSHIKFIGDYGQNKMNRDNRGSIKYSLGDIANSSFLFDTRILSGYSTGQVDWLQNLKPGWKLSTGAKWNHIIRHNELNTYEKKDNYWLAKPNEMEDFDHSEDIFAVYTSIEKSFNTMHYVKVGGRGEFTSTKGWNKMNGTNFTKHYMDIIPSLFYKYTTNNKSFLSLSYRGSINRPSFRDLTPFVIKQNDFLFQKGNPDLTPQYNYRVDFTYGLRKNEFSLFTRFSTDLIQQRYFVKDNVNYVQPLNSGKERNMGIDHTYAGNIMSWLYTNISSGVSYYRFKSAELEVSRPTFYNYIYIQAKLAQNFIIELFSNYDYKSQYRNTVGAYQYGLDISIQKRMLKNQLILKFSIIDIANTRRDNNVSTYTDFAFKFYQKRITRGILFSIQYTFENQSKIKYSTIESDNNSRTRL